MFHSIMSKLCLYIYIINSFNTRPPWVGGVMATSCMYGPPGRGVTLGFRFGIPGDKILQFVASFHLDNDLGHLITQTESRMLWTFSVRDISCKQNVKVLKLIHFLVRFGLGLDLFDSLFHRPSLASVTIFKQTFY